MICDYYRNLMCAAATSIAFMPEFFPVHVCARAHVYCADDRCCRLQKINFFVTTVIGSYKFILTYLYVLVTQPIDRRYFSHCRYTG